MPDIRPVLLKWTITLKDTILRVFAVRVLKLRKDAKPFIFLWVFFGVLFLLGGEGGRNCWKYALTLSAAHKVYLFCARKALSL